MIYTYAAELISLYKEEKQARTPYQNPSFITSYRYEQFSIFLRAHKFM